MRDRRRKEKHSKKIEVRGDLTQQFIMINLPIREVMPEVVSVDGKRRKLLVQKDGKMMSRKERVSLS